MLLADEPHWSQPAMFLFVALCMALPISLMEKECGDKPLDGNVVIRCK